MSKVRGHTLAFRRLMAILNQLKLIRHMERAKAKVRRERGRK